MALQLGETFKVPRAALVRGTGLRLSVADSPFRRVPWEQYATVMERLQDAVGGEEALVVRSRDTYRLVPEFNMLAASFRAPKRALAFLFRTVQPSIWPMIEVQLCDTRSRGVELKARLRPGHRACRAVFAWTAGATAGIPVHLGMAPAELHDLELTGRGMSLRLRFRRGGGGKNVRVNRGAEPASGRVLEVEGRLERAMTAWKLSPRQEEVLRHLVGGRDNQEIARELGCSLKTVEAHVTALLDRADEPSRLAVVAAFWRELG